MGKATEKKATEKRSFRSIRYEEKKEALVRAAAKAFCSSSGGFRAATFEAIAAELKMTKNSLYHYVRSKEELLYEVHKLAIPDVMGDIDDILQRPDPPDIKLGMAVKAYLKGLAARYEGCYLLQQESELSESHREEILGEWESYQEKLLRILREGNQAGVFAIRDEKITLFIILGAANWFLRWYSSAGRLGVDEIADLYLEVFLGGILAHSAELPASGTLNVQQGAKEVRKPTRAQGGQSAGCIVLGDKRRGSSG